MLDDCQYDKIKILQELSSIAWFIEKHAKENAKQARDEECALILEQIKKDLEGNIAKLKSIVYN